MKIVSSLFYIIKQRFAILIIAFFLAIVLFNTTYLGLGTYVPLLVIFLGLLTFSYVEKTKANKKNIYFIWLSIVILCSTLLSGGDQIRDCFKLFITICFLYYSSSIRVKDSEVRYLSLFICI